LESKLTPPAVRKEWLERDGLVGRLSQAAARLVVVCAPAGFGKTTLVAQWRASLDGGRRCGWVRLDRGDDDPVRLWRYIITALQRACPEIDGGDIEQALWSHAPQVRNAVLAPLVNELDTVVAPVVLVLEDYHVISERDCHDQIAFLLDHLPPLVQIVLITRADPPLRLARLRAAGEVTEIRAADLSFTPAQVAGLVQEVAGAQLSGPDLAVLVERTEGWPAGVYLAALSLRGHRSPHTFVQQFSGEHRLIVDFLADEVLSRQPHEVQRFLSRTSILDRFCAPLCQAVTGSADAAELIEALERENLFIVPLDETRQWYRYHQLFAALLRAQLTQTEPGLVPELHKRASEWHQRAGSPREAIAHASAGKDVGQAISLIARFWHRYVDAGQIATVRSWLGSLSDGQITASPVAAHCAAWAAAVSGDRRSVSRWLPIIETGQHAGPLPDGMRSLRFSAALLRAVCGFDSVQVIRESAVTAAGLEDDPAAPWYAAAQEALGYSLYLSGQAEAAAGPLREAVRTRPPCPATGIVAWSTLARVAADIGDLPEADKCLQTARGLARRAGLQHGPLVSLADIAAGAVAAAQGRLDQARSHLEHVLQFRQRFPGASQWPTVDAALLLAQVLLEAGNRTQAATLASQASETLTAFPHGAEALRARLGELEHLTAPRPAPVPGEPLTGQERAVLRLLGGSLSLRDIGTELHLSRNTVKTHTQAIYRKLGVSARADAIAWARELGILP
jgi:LuxR family maltose regulon positive regulatory protein